MSSIYECSYCFKNLETKESIIKHLEKEHKIFICIYCKEKLNSKTALKNHINKYHETEGTKDNSSKSSLKEKNLKTTKKEIYYQRLLEELLNCKKEKVPYGEIDEINKRRKLIIEIKNIKNWMHSIGQLEFYSIFYPEYKKLAFLFGKIKEEKKEIILNTLSNENIFVYFMEENTSKTNEEIKKEIIKLLKSK